jgi:hypothetical protein
MPKPADLSVTGLRRRHVLTLAVSCQAAGALPPSPQRQGRPTPTAAAFSKARRSADRLLDAVASKPPRPTIVRVIYGDVSERTALGRNGPRRSGVGNRVGGVVRAPESVGHGGLTWRVREMARP